ncbi:adenylate/guanylate cyclase domain-containing protein [Salinicola avicenniae]|uniref:adenylate/guanylate cyclase domain-containing protein n=1 Tax=Salinicola avicenniae TaxID=2916836 RepID=UPI002073CE57|nr:MULTISPECIES: adenylate/guanylate cyclase domain-containing protein [unclassified Salinicola]
MISKTQLPENLREIIKRQDQKYGTEVDIVDRDRLPSVDDIPGEDSARRIRIKDVICVFVDMKNSTKLSARQHAKSTSKTYTLFTGTATRIFRQLDASYIDIKGDGVFALFNYDQPHTALAAAVTFRTFVQEVFSAKVKSKTDIDTGVHIGIDQSVLVVHKVGLRPHAQRDDMHNEVWAGKAVNQAAKLASLSSDDEIHVSETFYKKLKSKEALYCCRCSPPTLLWNEVDVSLDERFKFRTAHVLNSSWCKTHGAEYMQAIVDAD